MMSRRVFLRAMGTGLALPLLACGGGGGSSSSGNTSNTSNGGGGTTTTTTQRWFMPDERAEHYCTWMAFGARRSVWGDALFPTLQDHLARVARTLAEYERVRMLVREADLATARSKCGAGVEMVVAQLDDVWIRDTGPVFVQDELGLQGAVDFNFNGWGNKQGYANDGGVARFVTQAAGVRRLTTSLVMEGGAIEVDGEGTAIITESCVLNANRNPGVTRAQVAAELKQLLGIDKIIWLPGIAGRDITDGHTDFYARFVKPGAVVAALEPDTTHYDYQLTRQHLQILKNATDARGRKLDVVTLEGPSTVRPAFDRPEFAAGYVNFYVGNGVVLAPEFGDAQADARALITLQELFPEHAVRQLNIDAIAAGGGGIHCVTQQEPLV
ncbi:MAG: agmatine deiminase family protein [Thiolinea sp.]